MANHHHLNPYAQRGLSSTITTTTTAPLTSTSTIAMDSSFYLPSSRYLSTYSSDPYSYSSYPTYPSFYTLHGYTPSALGDPTRSAADNSALPAATRSVTSGGATSSALWPAFDYSYAYAKRPAEALYEKSVVDAHMSGQSEAWLAYDSLAKRPRLESASILPIYPQRPGEKDCAHYMLTRTCRFGDNCKFDHPLWVPAGGIPDWKEIPSVPLESHPERPGEPDCPYFLKTEKCKFGPNCKFNHPKDKLGPLGNASDLPQRPSEEPCSFYMKNGTCKFGANCKFHHPKDLKIPSDGQEVEKSDKLEETNLLANVSMISDVNAMKTLTSSSVASYNSKGLPIRPGEADCPFYLKTGSCKYAANCRYSHPERNVVDSPAAAIDHSVLTSPVANLSMGLVNPAFSILQNLAQNTLGLGALARPAVYPQRPGQIECDYYMKSGKCRFGERCKFHHPVDRSAPKLTLAGLPRREDQTWVSKDHHG